MFMGTAGTSGETWLSRFIVVDQSSENVAY